MRSQARHCRDSLRERRDEGARPKNSRGGIWSRKSRKSREGRRTQGHTCNHKDTQLFCFAGTIRFHFSTVDHMVHRILKQLPIPEKLWNSISMDFIEKLPESSGYTSILVVVDRLSKQLLFIPTYDTITSQQLAQLFVLHIFSKHSVLSHVT